MDQAQAPAQRPRTLPELVSAIREAHRSVLSSMQAAIYAARDAGDFLSAAKEEWRRDEDRMGKTWERWVRDHCPFSPRTDRLYRRIAGGWELLLCHSHFAELTLSGAAEYIRQQRPRRKPRDKSPSRAVAGDSDLPTHSLSPSSIAKIYKAKKRIGVKAVPPDELPTEVEIVHARKGLATIQVSERAILIIPET